MWTDVIFCVPFVTARAPLGDLKLSAPWIFVAEGGHTQRRPRTASYWIDPNHISNDTEVEAWQYRHQWLVTRELTSWHTHKPINCIVCVWLYLYVWFDVLGFSFCGWCSFCMGASDIVGPNQAVPTLAISHSYPNRRSPRHDFARVLTLDRWKRPRVCRRYWPLSSPKYSYRLVLWSARITHNV